MSILNALFWMDIEAENTHFHIFRKFLSRPADIVAKEWLFIGGVSWYG